jgi:NADH dehydrogenase [ubiquinone] 1 alpha subcomplex assembly factor 7
VNALEEALVRRIRLAGPLTVADYMAEVLLHPAHGYYRRGDPLGAPGDFTTAPEISQMFGELIGLWCVDQWMRLGEPALVRLVELGPGRGSLMADALRAARLRPGLHAAIRLHLVESSPSLRERQATSLRPVLPAGLAPHWHDGFAEVPGDGVLLLIANEFFDALPIHQFVRQAGAWHERMVTVDEADRLVFVLGPPGAALALLAAERGTPAEGGTVEICPAGVSLAGGIARRIVAGGGAALIIDYGDDGGAGDSLQAVRRHAPHPPLADPGSADLTAHVDFAALARAAAAAGAGVHGPVTQGAFLHRIGIDARAATLAERASPAQRAAIAAAQHRLCDPTEMGTLFKAMAIVGPGAPAPPGFA